MLFQGGKASASASAQEPLVAIDIGASKIRLIAGEVDSNSEVHVTYYEEIESDGMLNSTVTDLNRLSNKLGILAQSYEEQTGLQLSKCIIGISGRHISSENEVGIANVPSHRVTEADRESAINAAQCSKFADPSSIIHRLPQTYEIDDAKDITNPIGLSALRLTVTVHLIACNVDQAYNLKTAVERLSPNVQVTNIIYNGIAAADAVLSQSDKEIGVCLIDFGAGTVNVAVYDNSKLVMTFAVEIAGAQATREIATKFGIPLQTAEFLKCEHGVAHPDLISEKDRRTILKIPVRNGDNGENVFIRRSELASTICYNLFDVFSLIRDRIEAYTRNTNKSLPLGAGFVITGGVAQTYGISALAANCLTPEGKNGIKVKTRVGYPRGVFSDEEDMCRPDYATAVGLLRYGHSANEELTRAKNIAEAARRSNSILGRASGWFKDWMKREF